MHYTHNILFGNDTTTSGGAGWSDYIYTSGPYVLASPTTITQLYIWSAVAGHAKLAVYNSSGTNPYKPVVASGQVSCIANSWNLVTVTSTLLPATDYFIAVKIDTSGMLASVTNYYHGQYMTAAYGDSFPSIFTTEGMVGADFAMYVASAPLDGTMYYFNHWEDSSANRVRLVTVTEDLNLTATYSTSETVSITITSPANTTYSTPTISVQLSASGGTIDTIWWNCKNGTSWIYGSNQTYTVPTSMTGFVNGSSYTFYGWANNTLGEWDEETVMFTVLIIVVPYDWGSFWGDWWGIP
jgi:hypothetical protein